MGDSPTNKREVCGGRNMFSIGGGCGSTMVATSLFFCLMYVTERGASTEREMCERDLLGIYLFLVTPVVF